MTVSSEPSTRTRAFLGDRTFDYVIFQDGEDELRYDFEDFRELPLRQRVHLLLTRPPRFYRDEVEISRVEAMRFQG